MRGSLKRGQAIESIGARRMATLHVARRVIKLYYEKVPARFPRTNDISARRFERRRRVQHRGWSLDDSGAQTHRNLTRSQSRLTETRVIDFSYSLDRKQHLTSLAP